MHKNGKTARQAQSDSEAYVFIQQGGASNEYYVHAYNTRSQAAQARKSCRKATYATSAIYPVPTDTDFDALQHRAETTLGSDDWEGIDELLSDIAP
ncbi:hypothetical protein [Mycobacteroides abscessus]|uniref:hypothetical protein n=1 Tax=Mycobacteroides abscessus TaxID=36809 RepID=UPI000302089A|nr:hypothetical protein [Mycobacteroides abscessus]